MNLFNRFFGSRSKPTAALAPPFPAGDAGSLVAAPNVQAWTDLRSFC